MTVGAVSNLGLGLGSTNYSQLYNDPYFLQALQSPNYYQLQAQNMQQVGTQVPTATATTNPSFKGASEQIAEKKKSNAGKWVLGILATAGTIFAAWKCHGKGIGENWYSKIWDGAEAVSKWKFKSSSVAEAAETQKPQLTVMQAVNQHRAEQANQIVRNMERVNLETNPTLHKMKQQRYEQFWEENADKIDDMYNKAMASKV